MHRTKAATLTLMTSLWATSAYAEQEKYTMEDLKALVEQESWIEVLDHAEDVRPSQRGETWSEYLQTAAVGHLNALKDAGDPDRAMAASEELIVKHPILKRSRRYMTMRGRLGLDAMENCFRHDQSGLTCSERLETFVKADPTNDNLAFEAGKLSRLRGSAHVSAKLFAMAFKKKSRRQSCNDEQVALAIERVLSNTKEGDAVSAARKIAFDYCWPVLKDAVIDDFLNAGSYYLSNTCADLKRKKVLTKFQLALCKDNA